MSMTCPLSLRYDCMAQCVFQSKFVHASVKIDVVLWGWTDLTQTGAVKWR